MSGAEVGLALSVLAACAVEAVEALTIVLAVGATRSWRSALTGVGAALLVLAVITAALGPAVTALPLGVLRVVVGGLLLIFGLQWLRKAILRASGLKALHDELAAFESEQAAARVADRTAFFSLDPQERVGTLVEYDDTNVIFSNPADTRTRDYVTGRFG